MLLAIDKLLAEPLPKPRAVSVDQAVPADDAVAAELAPEAAGEPDADVRADLEAEVEPTGEPEAEPEESDVSDEAAGEVAAAAAGDDLAEGVGEEADGGDADDGDADDGDADDGDADEAADDPVDPTRHYRPTKLSHRDDPEGFYATKSNKSVIAQVRKVLDNEAPLQFDVLARRVAEAWGVGRLTDRVRQRVQRAVVAIDPIEAHGALWPRSMDPGNWAAYRTSPPGEAAREAEQLPIIEVDNAMCWLLSQHGSLASDDLLREAARVFGITRLGRSVRAVMQAALDRLIEAGRAAMDAGIVRGGDAADG